MSETKTEDEDSSTEADATIERALTEMAMGRAKVEMLARSFALALAENRIELREIASVWTRDALATGDLSLDENGALQSRSWGSVAHYVSGHPDTVDTVLEELKTPVVNVAPIESTFAMTAIARLAPLACGRATTEAVERARPYLQAILTSEGVSFAEPLPLARLENAIIAGLVGRAYASDREALAYLEEMLRNTGGMCAVLERAFVLTREASLKILKRYRAADGRYRVRLRGARVGKGAISAVTLAERLLGGKAVASRRMRPSELTKKRKTSRRKASRQ